MAVVKPVVFTPIHDDEISINDPVQEEVLKKMIRNINMLRQLIPPGIVVPVHINLSNVELPNETGIWQLTDGSEITDPASPLNLVGTQNVPDLNDIYVTSEKSGYGPGNTTGGVASINLTHNHMIGVYLAKIEAEIGSDEDGVASSFRERGHGHTIPDDLIDSNAAYSKTGMRHMNMSYYMKII